MAVDRQQSNGRKPVPFSTGLLLFLWITCHGPARACPLELEQQRLSIGNTTLTVEVARQRKERDCGLSRRDALAPDTGMLFVFAKPQILKFWMRDTHIPLTIAFIESSGVITDLLDMQPDQTREHYHSSRPASYALEMPQGWFERHGLAIGDRLLTGDTAFR